MKIKAETDKLEQITYALSKPLNEGLLKFSDEGLSVDEPAPGNTTLLYLEAEKDFFEEYEIEEEVEKVGLQVEALHTLVKRTPTEYVTLETKNSKLYVEYENGEFSIPILDLEDNSEDIQDLEPTVEMKTKAGLLVDSLDNLQLVDEPISFKYGGDSLVLKAESSTSSGKIEVDAWDFGGEPCDTLIAEDLIDPYTSVMKKIIDEDSSVTLEYGQDYPLILKPEHGELEMSFVISPRIEER